MSHRFYFLAGDVLANMVCGALVGWAVVGMVPAHWPVVGAMLAAMVLGMLLSMLLQPFFLVFFGAMEVMLPMMLTGMLAGMLVGMRVAMVAVSGTQAAIMGAGVGLVVLLYTYVVNAMVRGEQMGHE